MKRLLLNAVVVFIVSCAGSFIGGNIALKKFETTHTTLTVYEKDAEFLFNDTQDKIFGEKEAP